jgi:CHAT domain-containing protein/tetratricopeptide (TPR) repeat protein
MSVLMPLRVLAFVLILFLAVCSVRAETTLDQTGALELARAAELERQGWTLSNGRNYQEAEHFFAQASEIRTRRLGPLDPVTVNSLIAVAAAQTASDRVWQAEELLQQRLHDRDALLDRNWEGVTRIRRHLAYIYSGQGRTREQLEQLQQVIALLLRVGGPDHRGLAAAYFDLAQYYRNRGQVDLAEPLYANSFRISEIYGVGDALLTNNYIHNVINVAHSLCGMSSACDPKAEALLTKALEFGKKSLGEYHDDIATIYARLSTYYMLTGHNDRAIASMEHAVAISEKIHGGDDIATSNHLQNLSFLYRITGRYDEAITTLKRTCAIDSAFSGPVPVVASCFSNLADLFRQVGRFESAYENTVISTRIQLRNEQDELRYRGRELVSNTNPDKPFAYAFVSLVATAWRLAVSFPQRRAELVEASYQAAQWVSRSRVAASLTGMAARVSGADTRLDALTRRHDDLRLRQAGLNRQVIAALNKAQAERDEAAIATMRAELEGVTRDAEATKLAIGREFPHYAELATPAPLSIRETQNLLGEHEVLMLFMARDDASVLFPEGFAKEAYVWAISRGRVQWRRLDMTRLQYVETLRCGLDIEEWKDIQRASHCSALLGSPKPADGDPLPFHFRRAHELYLDLFGSFEDMIKSKQLIVVPSGPLTSLPFHVLVTAPPEVPIGRHYEDYHDVAWLGRRHAMTVLPSVSSLIALRGDGRRSRARKEYSGWGNPVLTGGGNCSQQTRDWPSCEGIRNPFTHDESTRHIPRTAGRPSLDMLFRTGVAKQDVLTRVRALCPLPDTELEIKCVAEGFESTQTDLHLGLEATELSIKRLSQSGALSDYRIIHFATHGLLAGDTETLTKREGEPALVLTPPAVPEKPDDDGLLTASEIAQLRLNADWVILSACNTAAGDKLGAEALSGLATAFFYAGARGLLVSHWPVYSDAAVVLITRTFAEMRNRSIGRAEALRRAMISVMDDGSQVDNAHPSVWAPFVVVGL